MSACKASERPDGGVEPHGESVATAKAHRGQDPGPKGLVPTPTPTPGEKRGKARTPRVQAGRLWKGKGGRRVSEELPQTGGSSKKAVARPLGSPGQSCPSRIPAVPVTAREGLVSAWMDTGSKALSSSLGKTWRLSTTYTPGSRFSCREV